MGLCVLYLGAGISMFYVHMEKLKKKLLMTRIQDWQKQYSTVIRSLSPFLFCVQLNNSLHHLLLINLDKVVEIWPVEYGRKLGITLVQDLISPCDSLYFLIHLDGCRWSSTNSVVQEMAKPYNGRTASPWMTGQSGNSSNSYGWQWRKNRHSLCTLEAYMPATMKKKKDFILQCYLWLLLWFIIVLLVEDQISCYKFPNFLGMKREEEMLWKKLHTYIYCQLYVYITHITPMSLHKDTYSHMYSLWFALL